MTLWDAPQRYPSDLVSETHSHYPALPVEGLASSLIRVETWEDLACVDCWNWRRVLDETLIPKFGDRVAFVDHDFPLEKHVWAERAAMASRRLASFEAEAGLDFRRYCLEFRADVTLENFVDRLAEFAQARGLDAEATAMSLRDEDLRTAVRNDAAAGRARGVAKTPTVFVGDETFVEQFETEAVIAAIERQL